MKAAEVNIDGLVGPTHNYAGLSFGNVASQKHAQTQSNPKKAALQGLRKMKFLHDLGIPQIVMPPQPRPNKRVLKQLGYDSVAKAPLDILSQLYSASSMWVANAATISPGADTKDGKVHITPANLVSKFHRSIETPCTADYLKQIFRGNEFIHHDPLPAHLHYADEGAANHMRLCKTHDKKGWEIFVYGANSKKFPARQGKAASEAIARAHGLDPKRIVLLEQNSKAIDAGVFHNDVIAMSNERLFIYHEVAYQEALPALPKDFALVKIREKELSLKDAVTTYFFNSQLFSTPQGKMIVLAPRECEENRKAKACFDKLIGEGHIDAVFYLDLRESMKNGGGPACLRLRMVLNEKQRSAVLPEVWLNDTLYHALCQWIEHNYRDRISPSDLRDPSLAQESARALDGLSGLIKITMGAA